MRTLPFHNVSTVILLTAFLTACGSDDSSDPTAEVSCDFTCDCDMSSCGWNLSCESGSYSTEFQNESTQYAYDGSGRRIKTTKNISRVETYQSTGNAYTITGTIVWDLAQNNVDWNLQATGGAFGSSTRTCSGSKSF